MARNPAILYQGSPDNAAIDELYIVPNNRKTTITSIYAAQTSTSETYFSLYVVLDGSTYGSTNALMVQQKLDGIDGSDGGGLFVYENPIPLNSTGDTIQGIQQTAGSICLTIIGFTEVV